MVPLYRFSPPTFNGQEALGTQHVGDIGFQGQGRCGAPASPANEAAGHCLGVLGDP